MVEQKTRVRISSGEDDNTTDRSEHPLQVILLIFRKPTVMRCNNKTFTVHFQWALGKADGGSDGSASWYAAITLMSERKPKLYL